MTESNPVFSKRLPRAFYLQPTLTVARQLLGCYLVHSVPDESSPSGNIVTAGKIVEVEAYIGLNDRASHAYPLKKTPRTAIQFGMGGFAYVYLIYGMYSCMNVVTEPESSPAGVLIRALEPIAGLDEMRVRRKNKKRTPLETSPFTPMLSKKEVQSLCNGPGKLCQAMGIDASCYGLDLLGNELYIAPPDTPLNNSEIETSPRINIDYAGDAKDFLWRFFIKDNPFVSRTPRVKKQLY